MIRKKPELLNIISLISGFIVMFFIIFPVANTVAMTKPSILLETLKDKETMTTIWFSIKTATIASIISFILGTPFAYFLARKEFKSKNLIESLINIPIVLPHTVAGICLLTVLSPRCFLGKFLEKLGIETIGTISGIIVVMIFVGIPIYINAAKEAFKWIPERMENVSRTLGANNMQTFFSITFPLVWKDLLTGIITSWARAISEFGAVIIISYHPMVAPTYIYERFSSYGLSYAIPVTTILIGICLAIFVILRLIAVGGRRYD